jgi:hypothetical protein
MALPSDIKEIHQDYCQNNEMIFNDAINRVLSLILTLDINGKIIGLTGDGPYEEFALTSLIEKIGGIPDTEDIPWGDQEIIIIGKENYCTEYLKQAFEKIDDIQFVSQEDFIKALFLDETLTTIFNNETIKDHQGLKFVISLIEKGRTGDGPIEYAKPKLNEESFLRKKYGYTVAKGSTRSFRRNCLRSAVNNEGLNPVIEHIAFLLKINIVRSDSVMDGAISRWQEDIIWLQNEYNLLGNYQSDWTEDEG